MKTKRILATALAAIMCFTLTACHLEKPPTAEELLSGGTIAEVTSIDAEVELRFAANIALTALAGEGDGKVSLSGFSSMAIMATEDAQYTNGRVDINMLGMDYSEDIETYATKSPEGAITTYTKNQGTDDWTYTTEQDPNFEFEVGIISDLTADMFSDLKLSPPEKNAAIYTVTGTVSAQQMLGKAGVDAGEMLGMGEAADSLLTDAILDATLHYDCETKQLMDVELILNLDTVSSDDVEITEFALTITVNSINDVEVQVPDNVMKRAFKEGTFSPEADPSLDVEVAPAAGDSF